MQQKAKTCFIDSEASLWMVMAQRLQAGKLMVFIVANFLAKLSFITTQKADHVPMEVITLWKVVGWIYHFVVQQLFPDTFSKTEGNDELNKSSKI